MNNLEFLKRAAEKTGFVRSVYVDNNVPTNPEDIVVVHFFGDLRSEVVLSSLVLNRFKEELKGSKYMILCGWGGHQALFPYVDEYWSPRERDWDKLSAGALGFDNDSEVYVGQRQNLNYFFRNLIDMEEIKEFYDCGFTTKFIQRLGLIRRFLPLVPSASYLSAYFNQEIVNRPGFKVLIMPSKCGRGIKDRYLTKVKASQEFYDCLVERLISSGYCPVILQNHATYDLSGKFHDKAICIQEEDFGKVLGMMRATGCVLDLFGGLSRLAIMARTPFVAVDERERFRCEKESQIDDLCADKLLRQYIFGFSTIIGAGDSQSWNASLFDQVVVKLNLVMKMIDRNSLPSTLESVVEMPFSMLREQSIKKMSTKFIKVPKD